jgi:ABC-type sulfate transport system permease subunit
MYQKAWFMWFWLIVFTPVGILLMWRQRRFTKFKRIIVTLIATAYFVFPIVAVMTTTLLLYNNQEEFLEAFDNEAKELKLSYSLNGIRKPTIFGSIVLSKRG